MLEVKYFKKRGLSDWNRSISKKSQKKNKVKWLKDFRKAETRILGSLTKLDWFISNSQVLVQPRTARWLPGILTEKSRKATRNIPRMILILNWTVRWVDLLTQWSVTLILYFTIDDDWYQFLTLTVFRRNIIRKEKSSLSKLNSFLQNLPIWVQLVHFCLKNLKKFMAS